MWQAKIEQGAPVAFLLALGAGRDPVVDQLPEACDGLAGASTQSSIERNLDPPSNPAVVQRTRRDSAFGQSEHLLKAKCLSAKLHTVCVVPFGASPLVLHGERPAPTFTAIERSAAQRWSRRYPGDACNWKWPSPELDDIRLSYQAQTLALQGQASDNQRVASSLGAAAATRPLSLAVGAPMEDIPFHSQSILCP